MSKKQDNIVTTLLNTHREANIGKRYSFFPIKDERMYAWYKKQESAIWSSNEMDFSVDKHDYDKLRPEYKKIIDTVNAFFSATDGLIIDNIAVRFLLEAKSLEEQAFYIEQLKIEVVHAETYSLIINTLITDEEERNKLHMAAENMECVRGKTEWLQKHMESQSSISHRRLAFACGEGIFFTSSFLFIFFFRSMGILPNIIFANEQISKDEGMHRDAALDLYRYVDTKLTDEEAFEIVGEAVDLECRFVDEILPVPMEELKAESVKKYVKFLGDHLLVHAGHPRLYNIDVSDLPTWMNDISMEQKSNFYEVRVGNYKQSNLKKALDWKGRIKGDTEKMNVAFTDPMSVDF